jgi:hypothetical protein
MRLELCSYSIRHDTKMWLVGDYPIVSGNGSNPLFRNRDLGCVDAASTANTLEGTHRCYSFRLRVAATGLPHLAFSDVILRHLPIESHARPVQLLGGLALIPVNEY